MNAPASNVPTMPQQARRFIGYSKNLAAARHPETAEGVQIRPQVFVQWLPGVKVTGVTIGGRKGNSKGDAKTARVDFDPESIGWKESFASYIRPDDPLVQVLQQAAEAGTPLNVVLETHRRNADADKNPISPLAPIHAIRGGKRDGSSASMDAAKGRVSNVIAYVDGQATMEAECPLEELAFLAESNRCGDIAPPGYKVLAPLEEGEWEKYGALVASDVPGGVPGGGAGIDPTELAKLVQQAVQAALEAHDEGKPKYSKPYPAEGKRWDARTNDGRINLGGYPVAQELRMCRDAYTYLVEVYPQHTAELQPDDLMGLARTIADYMVVVADKVQVAAYDNGRRPFPADRTVASYSQIAANLWWLAREVVAPPTYEDLTATEGAGVEHREQWLNTLGSGCTQMLRAAAERVDVYYRDTHPTKKNQAHAEDARQGTPPQQQAPQQQGPTPEAAAAIDKVVAAVARDWDNIEALKGIGARANTIPGLHDHPVSVKAWADGVRVLPGTVQGADVVASLYDILVGRIRGTLSLPGQQQQAPQQQEGPAEGTAANVLGVDVQEEDGTTQGTAQGGSAQRHFDVLVQARDKAGLREWAGTQAPETVVQYKGKAMAVGEAVAAALEA